MDGGTDCGDCVGVMSNTTITADEMNDAIRAYIGRGMVRPRGGFESDDAADEFRAAHDAEFVRIQALPLPEILALIGR